MTAVAAGGTAPVVLFADREPWESFTQFAAALRRRGVRVERLTARDRSPVRRCNDLLQRPVFPRIRPVLRFTPSGRLDVADLPAHLPHGVLAWEAVDAVAAEVAARGLLPRRTASPAAEALLGDKLGLTRRAAELGVPVPGSWAAEEGAAGRLPYLVKPRLGAGGQGVALVEDGAADAALVRTARARPGSLMGQERVRGELLHVGGVARDGAIVLSACYRGTGAAAFGPSASVVVLDDPAPTASATALIGALGYTGAFGMDFVRDGDGRPLLIDVNARIFGSWAALQEAGLDLVGAYLYAHGLGPRPAPRVLPVDGRPLSVLPPDLALTGTSLPAAIAAYAGQIRRGLPVAGPRWAVSAGARLAGAAVVQGIRRPLRRSGGAP